MSLFEEKGNEEKEEKEDEFLKKIERCKNLINGKTEKKKRDEKIDNLSKVQ